MSRNRAAPSLVGETDTDGQVAQGGRPWSGQVGADRLGQGLAERLTLGRVGTVVQVGGGGLLCFLWGSGEHSERAQWA